MRILPNHSLLQKNWPPFHFTFYIVGWVNVSLIASQSRKDNENVFNLWMAKKGLKHGGMYSPRNCKSPNVLAIIVPYRKREFHLKIFLRYIHPFLMRQQLEYTVFVVEQSSMRYFKFGFIFYMAFLKKVVCHSTVECLWILGIKRL